MSHRTTHGLINGPIEVVSLLETERGSAVRLLIGDVSIDVQATLAGHKASVTVTRQPASKTTVAIDHRTTGLSA